MKAIFTIIVLLISISSFAQNTDQELTEREQAVKDSIIVQKILAVKLKRYRGKTIGQLLQNDTVKLYNGYLFTDEPPGKLQSLDLMYPAGLALIIYPYEKHGQAVQVSISSSGSGSFDFEALKKIRIRKLILVAEPIGSNNQF